jgi:hypothetical protein
MPQPFVQRAPDARRLRQPEIGFPSQEVRSQAFDDLTHAAPARTPRQLLHLLLERRQWFGSDLALDLPFGGKPEAIAQKLASRDSGHALLLSLTVNCSLV